MSRLELPEGETFDLDLGDEHYLQWIEHSDGERVGAVIYHPRPGPPRDPALWTPWCAGSVMWKLHGNPWTMQGQADEHLTLSPSIRCDCGDHGYIRNGKWERA